MQTESDAIKNLILHINEDFESAVQAILQLRGRVVVTGIGKSAIVAQKIVATFNSTGTPSIFMHAADAIHGDLGMVQSEDLVICLSKSGNTPEIKVLVPLLRRTGCKIIALVGQTDSYLAKHADYVLNASIEKEACPHNLAPTTSTTAALVMGDALAIVLLELRDFSSADFARFHPGGALGKRLYLKVSDIYPDNPKPCVSENAGLKEIIVEISSRRLGATGVVNERQELTGIITDGDLRRMLNKHDTFVDLKAKDIMTPSPKVIGEDAYAVEALQIMQEKNITQLIVVRQKEMVGFVHLHDLLKEGII